MIAVSIHAPAWGATLFGYNVIDFVWVSIHAPAWGATDSTGRTWYDLRFQSTLPHGERRVSIVTVAGWSSLFQSTLPHGERQIWLKRDSAKLGVSIHAPAWGATHNHAFLLGTTRFNPRSRMGSDIGELDVIARVVSFNPRSRMGSDLFAT